MSIEKAVMEQDDAFFHALNEVFAGDAASMEALWSHRSDVIYMGPVPELFNVGWSITDADWLEQVKMKLGGSIKVVQRHVVIGQELSVVHHLAEASGQDPENPTATHRMRGTNVYRIEDGVWKLISHHSDPLAYVSL